MSGAARTNTSIKIVHSLKNMKRYLLKCRSKYMKTTRKYSGSKIERSSWIRRWALKSILSS